MRIHKKFLPGFFFLLGIAACKAPKADFTGDSNNYINGDNIYLKNTSKGSTYFEWSGTGISGTSTNKDLEIRTTFPGEYQITLTAFSRNKKKTDACTKIIKVKKARGDLVIYTMNSTVGPISISVDNFVVGTLFQSIDHVPNCGEALCLTLDIEEGDHLFSMTANGLTVPFTYPITARTCNKMKVY